MFKIINVLLFFFSINCTSQLLNEEDKQLHFGAGALVSSPVFSTTYIKTNNLKKAWINSFLAAALVGTAKELIDNKFDKRDLKATVLGGLTSSTLLTITIKLNEIKWRKSNKSSSMK